MNKHKSAKQIRKNREKKRTGYLWKIAKWSFWIVLGLMMVGAGAAFGCAFIPAQHGIELQRGRNQQRQVEAHQRLIVGKQGNRLCQIVQLAAGKEVQVVIDAP